MRVLRNRRASVLPYKPQTPNKPRVELNGSRAKRNALHFLKHRKSAARRHCKCGGKIPRLMLQCALRVSGPQHSAKRKSQRTKNELNSKLRDVQRHNQQFARVV